MTPSMLANAKILVADDDAELLSVVARALEASGASVVCAASGAELMELLADEGPFALVVTDVSMPWMDGLQAMFSARHAGLATPVLVMTGLDDDGVTSRIRALEPKVSLLRKPFDLAALHQAAERLLSAYPPEEAQRPDAAARAAKEDAKPSLPNVNLEWLESLFAKMAEAIVLVDAEGRVVMTNPAAQQQFFSKLGDALRDTRRGEAGDSRAPFTLELRRHSGEQLSPGELPSEHGADPGSHESRESVSLRCSDGTLVPVLVSATPLRIGRQHTGTVLVFERESPEAAARAEWATAIAHDLRQPINSIMLTSDLLLQGALPDDQRQHLLRVQSSAKRLSRMVGDMTKLAGQSSQH